MNNVSLVKIYLVTNCYNEPNTVYIGKTTSTRYHSHKKTFGPNIIYTIIDQVDSLDSKDWKSLETFWIFYIRSLGFKVLNKNDGGGGLNFHSNETKYKKSKSMKGKFIRRGVILSQEIRDKMALAAMGKPKPWLKGRVLNMPPRTEEMKNKLRKPILQYNLKGDFLKEWPSAKQVEKELKIPASGICCVLKGKQKTCHGFVWKYKK